jgi:hypothetical protein
MTKNTTEETCTSKEVRTDIRAQIQTPGMIHSIIPPHMLKEISTFEAVRGRKGNLCYKRCNICSNSNNILYKSK